MTKKKKGELVSVTALCERCNTAVTVDKNNSLYLSGWVQACDICGEHSGVMLNFECPNCKKNNHFEIGD